MNSLHVPKWLFISIALVSFVGFLDATYLTAQHYLGFELNCSVFNGCDIVTTSEYSVVAGVPVALLGALYYFVLFIGMFVYFDLQDKRVLRILMLLTVFGFFTSLWFLYLQIFVIKALCLYCIVSATTSTALFILGMFALFRFNILKN